MVFPKKGKEPEMPWEDEVRHKIKSAIFSRCHSINIAQVDMIRKVLDIFPEKDHLDVTDKEHACLLISEKPEEVRSLNILADMIYPYEYWWD